MKSIPQRRLPATHRRFISHISKYNISINGTIVTIIHVTSGLYFISRVNTVSRFSKTGIWLETIAVIHTTLPRSAIKGYHICVSPKILFSDVDAQLKLIIASENNITIHGTVNHDDIITLRILITLAPVEL